jgi:isopentenyl phosphate kinase
MDGWVSNDAVVTSADLTCVHRCLQLDILPVLHGDVVFDSSRGYTVVSGDDIMQELSRRLHPPFVMFVSDVPGVFLIPPSSTSAASTSDPSFISLCVVDASGCILRLQRAVSNSKIDEQNHELTSFQVGGSTGTDVTGGAIHDVFYT